MPKERGTTIRKVALKVTPPEPPKPINLPPIRRITHDPKERRQPPKDPA